MIRKEIKDFVQSMVDAGVYTPEAVNNDEMLRVVQKIVDMGYIKALITYGDKGASIYNEFTDWIETYEGQK